MAFERTSGGGTIRVRVDEFVCDTRSDIASLPVAPDVHPGSTALVAEDSSVFILTPNNTWEEI